MALEMGELITADVQVIQREVDLPRARGKQTVDFGVTGLVAFLAAKADALRRRDKPKDAYDIVWLLEAWPAGAAEAVRRSPHAGHRGLAHALEVLEDQFRDLDRAGARAYAGFMAEAGADHDLLARRAVGAVREFLNGLRP